MTICNKDYKKSKKGHNVKNHNRIKNDIKNLKNKNSIGPSATFKHLTQVKNVKLKLSQQ
jgi:hypothetical protein